MNRKDEEDLTPRLRDLMKRYGIELSLRQSQEEVRALLGQLKSVNCCSLSMASSLDSVRHLNEAADEIVPFLYVLAEKFGDGNLWGEHPRFPRRYWCHAVANEETNNGYWFWLLGQLAVEEQ